MCFLCFQNRKLNEKKIPDHMQRALITLTRWWFDWGRHLRSFWLDLPPRRVRSFWVKCLEKIPQKGSLSVVSNFCFYVWARSNRVFFLCRHFFLGFIVYFGYRKAFSVGNPNWNANNYPPSCGVLWNKNTFQLALHKIYSRTKNGKPLKFQILMRSVEGNTFYRQKLNK